ncbi:MAG: hypothetical protein EOM85_00710 [Candidatus Moranbacteria bacterium]|nr:hypothetical protein [Candidatus Moranbacteria bacterium]
MTKAIAITQDIRNNITTQKVLLRILLTTAIVLSICYVYLIGNITFNIVARKSLESTIANLSAEVDRLDLAYLNKVNEIDREYALNNGFVENHQNIFVSRDVNHVAIR